MFSIYTPAGRAFYGPLEKLRRVTKPDAADLSRTVTGSTTPAPELELNNEFHVSQSAVRQYQSMLENEGQREPVYHAYQLMETRVQVIYSDWTIEQCLQHFREQPYNLYPVINKKRQLIGTLSRIQLYQYLLDDNNSDIHMSHLIGETFFSAGSEVYCADPITDIRRIAAIMVEHQLTALPIVEENGRIIGIISRSDILGSTTTDPPLSLWC